MYLDISSFFNAVSCNVEVSVNESPTTPVLGALTDIEGVYILTL